MNPTLPFESRHTRLRPPSQMLIETLYEYAVTGEIPWQWPSPAETPETFANALWGGVLAQYAIEDKRTNMQVGLVTAYGANIFHGFAYVSMTLLPGYRRRVWPLEGALLFANYLFTRFNLRNLYSESADPDFMQFGSGEGKFFDVEGRLQGRFVINGEPQDLYIMRISRERWLDRGVELLRHCTSAPGGTKALVSQSS